MVVAAESAITFALVDGEEADEELLGVDWIPARDDVEAADEEEASDDVFGNAGKLIF